MSSLSSVSGSFFDVNKSGTYVSTIKENAFSFQTVRYILLIKTTAAQNEVALSCHRVRGLCVLVVYFATTIIDAYKSYHSYLFLCLSYFC